MHDDEKKVRDAWEDVGESDGPCTFVVFCRFGSTDIERSIQGLGYGDTMAAAWSAAAAYTDKRKQQIAEIDEEIAWLEGQRIHPIEIDKPQRVISRLQAARAELRRGMRGEA